LKLSVIVPVWNRCDLVSICLESVRRGLHELSGAAEVIVVDDGSEDGSAQMVANDFPECRLLENGTNRGFAVAANRGMSAGVGEFLLLLNSDTELTAGTLSALVALLEEDPQREVVAPRLVDAEGRTQKSCMAWPELSTAFFFGTPMERWQPDSREIERYFLRDFDHESARDDVQPPASCWLMRRKTWERIGEFDQQLELFFNDVDWAQRLVQAGGKIHYRPEVSVSHVGGASTTIRPDFVERWQIDRLRYYRKHFDWMGGLVVKACVSWTFADWWVRQRLEPATPEKREESASVQRAFGQFMWDE
jgi:GT2 family glycosyltransferase